MWKRSVSRSPDRVVSADDAARGCDVVLQAYVVPEFDSRVKRTGHDLVRVITIPVDAVNLGGVRSDSRKRIGPMASIPDVKVLVVSTCNNLVVLAVPLDLGCPCGVVGKLQWRLAAAKIMDEDKAVNAACGQKVWMMCGEVDVCYSSVMCAQGVFDGRFVAVVRHGEIVHKREVVSRRRDPLGACCKGGPLHICDIP